MQLNKLNLPVLISIIISSTIIRIIFSDLLYSKIGVTFYQSFGFDFLITLISMSIIYLFNKIKR